MAGVQWLLGGDGLSFLSVAVATAAGGVMLVAVGVDWADPGGPLVVVAECPGCAWDDSAGAVEAAAGGSVAG